ncbi:hypothetical protein niasHT_037528 [Heterodera trifolii]|uniref:Cytoplasmic dynein 2 light intermediate chain 1 n=1 Tax=Heterodera trifolii TaxID=157864 RepID=A0ABD2IUU8_9BILA
MTNEGTKQTNGEEQKDIWTTIRQQYEQLRNVEEQQQQKSEQQPPAECSLIFCGSSNSGKSLLSSLFLSSFSSRHFSSSSSAVSSLSSSSTDQKTIALEFRFGQRIISEGNGKQLANVWELAGGGTMAPLVQVPLAMRNIHSTSLLLFVDLTRPELFQSVADSLLTVCRKRIERLKSGDEMAKLIGQIESQDKKAIRPLGIQLVIVCARYDEFQNANSEQKRQMYRLIRQFAHINGAAIITLSIRMDTLLTKARTFLYDLISGIPLQQFQKSLSTDPQHPLFVVPHGIDSFEDINPSLRSLGSFSEAMLNFLQSLNQTFAQQQQKVPDDEAENEAEESEEMKQQLAEPTIDALVEERMKQLELFAREKRDQKEAEKRAADRRN